MPRFQQDFQHDFQQGFQQCGPIPPNSFSKSSPCGFIPAKTILAMALMPRFQQDFQQGGPIPHNHPDETSDGPSTL